MKKLFLLFGLLVLVGTATMANVSQYTVNDNQIEALFAQAQPSMLQVTDDLSDFAAFPVTAPPMLKSKKSPVVAFILCWVVGSLGIHRFYLGTKTMTGVGYILTCGGLGIVTFVDWIVLLIGVIEDDIKKYVDNPRFFMW